MTDEAKERHAQDWPKPAWVVDARDETNPMIIGTLPLPPVEEYREQDGRFGAHNLHEYSKQVRDRLWHFAIRAAQEKFGSEWGIAYNGAQVRTQCHLHLHIGRFVRAAETGRFKFVRRVEDFPAPEDSGLWVHPVEGGFHVHLGEQITETALVR